MKEIAAVLDNYSWWVCEEKNIFADLLDECLDSLSPFSLGHSFHAISLFRLHDFWLILSQKTTIFLFIFQLCAFFTINEING